MKTTYLCMFKLILFFSLYANTEQQILSEKLKESKLLNLLNIKPYEESIDYVVNKKQFQLHTLLTEQRHSKTWDLGQQIQKDYEKGLSMLFSVDEDIFEKLKILSMEQKLEQMIKETEKAILSGNKIYIYGCGATGRLAKQIESSFWRPFWNKIRKKEHIWGKIKNILGEDIEERLIGEMTGGDRALISSLEGFEDLMLIGQMQLNDRKIKKGDVVIAVTEGGETSSVIGTVLEALNQWKETPESSRKKIYFICNNPEEKLNKFERSKKVLQERGVTKINLTTGPQAIAGSTRMQATTIEIFVIANAIQKAVENSLRKILFSEELVSIGFESETSFKDKLKEFSKILNQVKEEIPSIAKLTELETKTYESQNFVTYFAEKGLLTVFTDSTERSPTFRILPLDQINQAKRECCIQVWAPALTQKSVWQILLGRSFHGLSLNFYKESFEK